MPASNSDWGLNGPGFLGKLDEAEKPPTRNLMAVLGLRPVALMIASAKDSHLKESKVNNQSNRSHKIL